MGVSGQENNLFFIISALFSGLQQQQQYFVILQLSLIPSAGSAGSSANRGKPW